MSNNCSKCRHWVFKYNQTDQYDVKYNTRGECCIRSVCDDNFPERDMDECCDEFEAKADGWPTPIGWWESVNPSSVATPTGKEQSPNIEGPAGQDKEHCNCAVCCEVRGWQNE